MPCWGLGGYLRAKINDLGRSQETFGKREREAKRAKKKKEKELKKQEAKNNKRSLDSPEMFAYVDEIARHSSPSGPLKTPSATPITKPPMSVRTTAPGRTSLRPQEGSSATH